MDPTTPAMHWAMTNLGLLMMNSGEPITGKGTAASAGGNLDMADFGQCEKIDRGRQG
jgi:hypothetical protein